MRDFILSIIYGLILILIIVFIENMCFIFKFGLENVLIIDLGDLYILELG